MNELNKKAFNTYATVTGGEMQSDEQFASTFDCFDFCLFLENIKLEMYVIYFFNTNKAVLITY